jgi:hypothetical protein
MPLNGASAGSNLERVSVGNLKRAEQWRGWGMFYQTVKAGLVLLCAVMLIAGSAGPLCAQNKELSEKSVMTLMRYAWSMVPDKFTTPLGKTILVDRSKPSESLVPMEIAREVIHVARLSAYAQLCELTEEQRANYQTFMRREQAKGKWSDQQMLFINQLHLFTVMTLTGKVQLVEKDGDKQVVVQEGKPVKTESCTDTEKQKIQAQIMTFVKANPPPAAPPVAPEVPAKRAEPMPASQKK